MEDASTLSSEREEQKRVLREVLLSKWQELKGLIDEQIDTAVVIPSSFDERGCTSLQQHALLF